MFRLDIANLRPIYNQIKISFIIAYMDQHCKHNGIPLIAHFMSWNFDLILYGPEDGYI
jgi:hypothetical protein